MKRKAQSSIEYFIIMIAVLLALYSSNFLGHMQGVFQQYFDKAAPAILNK